ncbi:MAG: hypothetical protein HFH77_07380 [Lachnospiraceae bacterium]|jgi:hypothetical protein|nr:hypothetical protein [Lachnospiraceae bacterium]
MAVQLIFCVETNKKADTDSIYISELVNYFYVLNNQIKISKVYMGTNKISQFCKENGYDLVWFCHDVEEVFLDNKIPDSQKVQEAGAFRRKKGIQEIPLDKLASSVMRIHTSNIMQILDKYLERKMTK